MKWLITITLLAIGGLAAVVFHRESERASHSGTSGSISTDPVATITRGARVDVAAHVPSTGKTIVYFTADW